MVEINGTVGHGNAKVKRLLGEQIVVQADFPARAAFELDVAEVRVIAARNEAERTIRGQMPARDVFGAEAEAHAEAGLAHDRFTGAHAQFEHQTVLEPVTAAEGVRVFIQTLILGERAGMMLATLVGCVDDNKDLYDPTITADNPLDITAPDGFDWSTTNTIRLSVEANDAYNGQYDYIIEVFDNNPIASAADSISSLAKGVAKSGHPFVLSVTIAKSTTDLFIRQTDPKGRAVIRSFPVQSNMT